MNDITNMNGKNEMKKKKNDILIYIILKIVYLAGSTFISKAFLSFLSITNTFSGYGSYTAFCIVIYAVISGFRHRSCGTRPVRSS
jgi:hypothetical protein